MLRTDPFSTLEGWQPPSSRSSDSKYPPLMVQRGPDRIEQACQGLWEHTRRSSSCDLNPTSYNKMHHPCSWTFLLKCKTDQLRWQMPRATKKKGMLWSRLWSSLLTRQSSSIAKQWRSPRSPRASSAIPSIYAQRIFWRPSKSMPLSTRMTWTSPWSP